MVPSWFSRRRPPVAVPTLRGRRRPAEAARVDLSDLTPDPIPYLGQAACLEFAAFETLSLVVATLPDFAAKETVGTAAGLVLERYRALVPEIERRGEDPHRAMEPFAAEIARFRAATAGHDWAENLLRVHVTAGILDDFFLGLAGGLPHELRARVRDILGRDAGQEGVSRLLRETAERDRRVASRLALWGRRLVGDALLVARSALRDSATLDEERMEPVFTELIAEHTRRMDALGLTA